MKSKQHNKEKFLAILLGVVLLSSITPINSAYAAVISVTFPSTPSDGNLSNTGPSSVDPKIAISGSDIYVVWRDGDDIFFINSTDSGANFLDSADDIGDGSGTFGGEPKISVSGSNIYTVWRDDNDIKFNRSTDGGQNFAGASIELSSATSSRQHDLDSSGNNVYSVWRHVNTGDDDIAFIASGDNGANFGSILDIGDTDMVAGSPSPQVASSGTNVYVVWQDSTDILFTRSTDSGANFGAVTDIGDSNGSANSNSNPRITLSGSNVYVVWEQSGDLRFARNTNDGNPANWSAPVDIGDVDGVPNIQASGTNVYVAWQDDTPGVGDIKFIRSTDSGANFGTEIDISLDSATSTTPEVSVSGTNVFVVWTTPSTCFSRSWRRVA